MAATDKGASDPLTEESVQESAVRTPDELIATTIDKLRGERGTDLDLLEILAQRILITNPADASVANAFGEIVHLAGERAKERGNGSEDIN